MKHIILIILIFLSTNSFSQTNDKFHFYSVSVSPIGLYKVRNTTMAALSADITFNKKNNYFKLFALVGDEIIDINFGDSKEESDVEFTLMYGKEIFNEKIKFNFYVGTGYYKYGVTIPKKIPNTYSGGLFGSYDYEDIDYSQDTIGFALQMRMNYVFKNNFSLGLQLHTNLNSINNVFSMGLVLEWIGKNN